MYNIISYIVFSPMKKMKQTGEIVTKAGKVKT